MPFSLSGLNVNNWKLLKIIVVIEEKLELQ